MEVSKDYVVVKRVEEPKSEGFQTVEIQDSFVYKGRIVKLPGVPVYISNEQLAVDDVVIFHKYSPDSVEIDFDGEKQKFIKTTDLLAVLK